MRKGYGFAIIVLLVMNWLPAIAQRTSTLPRCAIPELTQKQINQLDNEAKLALALKQANGVDNASPTLTYIPVRPHLFRSRLGAGGMDLAKLNRVLATTNRYFQLNGSGMQFYFAGSVPDYIDNDTYNQQFALSQEETIVGGRDANNALNLYMVNAFDDETLGGYAYFPSNTLTSTRLIVLNQEDEDDLGNRLLPHEMGHIFNLYHTFQNSTGSTPELVTRGAGANCSLAGDLICDTPADPYGRPGATISNAGGCQQYNGTATDPQGDTYNPAVTNLMSYYHACGHDFTPGQLDRMASGLALRQTHTAYTLGYPPGSVAAPTNVVATLSANAKAVVITWRDQASNEMGYFVERATKPDGDFSPVGGAGPNQTTVTDASVQANVTYYYRVKPSNTTTGSFSPTIPVTVPVCRPTYTSSCSATNGIAQVVVNGAVLSTASGCASAGYSASTSASVTVGAGQTVPVSATLLNANTALYAAVWVDLNRNGSFETGERLASRTTFSTSPVALSITLPVSLTTGALPMRIVTTTNALNDACSAYAGGETEDYVLTVGTVAECPVPTALTATVLTGTSAQLSWAANGSSSYGLQYRPAGAASWTLASTVSRPHTLTGLSAGTTYEWQVVSVCGSVGSSPLSSVASFSTPCATPTSPGTTAIYGNSAQLNWDNVNTTYRLQWKPVASTTWAVVSGVANNTYAISGLTGGTTYQWQVAAMCPSGTVSAFSEPISFTTTDVVMYCRPTRADGCSEDDGLAGLRLGDVTLSDNSGCSPNSYQSFSAVVANLIPEQAYAITATLLGSSWPEGMAIWVDLNRNGTLEASERLYASPSTATGTLRGSLTIPAGTAAGRCLLRARVSYDAIPADPCAVIELGETEDYVINVCAPPTASLLGSRTLTSGQTATLTAQLTGGAPWSLTLSTGATFGSITTSPFTITVSPPSSTTYAVSRVANACGMGTVSGVVGLSVVAAPVPMTDLALSMTSNRRTPKTGDVLTITTVVTNEGSQSASNIVATCLLPTNLTFAGSPQAAVTHAGGAVTLTVGTLLPGTSNTMSFSVLVGRAGRYRLAGQLAAASLPDPDSFLNSGTSDGEDDMAVVELRTVEADDAMYESPNPNPRPLPAVQSSQPASLSTEADLSLDLWASQRLVISGGELRLFFAVSNRGGQVATSVSVQVQLPTGWQVTNAAGLSVSGQVVTITIASIAVGQPATVAMPVRVAGTGEQRVTGLITAATQPDSDSPHNNGYGRGEDDEAALSVRVQ